MLTFQTFIILNYILKVLRQRSSQSLVVSPLDFVVSRSDLKSEYRARGLQMHPGTSETPSVSPVKCTRLSVCSEVSKSMISYLERGGGQTTVCPPPPCEDLCRGTLIPEEK